MSYTFDLHVRQNNIQVSDLTQAKEKVQTNRLCQAKSGPSFFRHMRSQKHSACLFTSRLCRIKRNPQDGSVGKGAYRASRETRIRCLESV